MSIPKHYLEHQLLGVEDVATLDARYLKLDQTTPQSVLNGTPVFTANLTVGKVSGTTGQVSFVGTTSGTIVLKAQDAAGTPTLTLPNTTGTIPSSASAPIAINATTGAITHSTSAGYKHVPTAGSSNQLLKNSGSSGTAAWGTVTESSGALGSVTTISMSGQLTNTLATGTSPFAVTSTTVNTNLNADLLDGNHASAFEPSLTKGNLTTSGPLSFDQTRQVIGGAAALSFDVGTTALTKYLLLTGGTITGQTFIDGSSDQIQLRVQANSSQTANRQTWENSSSGVDSFVDSEGRIVYGSQPYATTGFMTSYPSVTSLPSAYTCAAVGRLDITATTNQANYGYGVFSEVVGNGTADYAALVGVGGYGYSNTSGTTTGLYGLTYAIGNLHATGGVVTAEVLSLSFYSPGAGQIYNATCINLPGNTFGGQVVNLYGLKIANISGAVVDNYAIYTSAGDIRLMASASDKLGLYGATPVVQQAHIINADGTLSDITTKFNSLLSKLEAYGLLATS